MRGVSLKDLYYFRQPMPEIGIRLSKCMASLKLQCKGIESRRKNSAAPFLLPQINSKILWEEAER